MTNYKLILLFQDTKTQHIINITLITNTPFKAMQDTIKEYEQKDYKFIQFIIQTLAHKPI